MSYVLDTNLLLRLAQPHHPMRKDVLNALDEIGKLKAEIFIIPQSLFEFWVVATRPFANNGLAMSIDEAADELKKIKALFSVVDDNALILPEWERIVIQYQVSGKQAHDARIVAAMNVHAVKNLLTFNIDDFKRYTNIKAVDPRSITTA
jgi:predicted nucleic acid-binding protein